VLEHYYLLDKQAKHHFVVEKFPDLISEQLATIIIIYDMHH